jgi:alpha-beta hydrolase superfamily lysophospholipase
MNIDAFNKKTISDIEGILTSSFTFNRGTDENFLYGRSYETRSTEKRHVIFLHDIGEHGNRYQDFFHSFLNHFKDPDLAFHTLDFRGHGKSSGTRGHLKSIDDLCLDIIGLTNQLEESDRPVVFMGLGLGGIVALKILHLHFSLLTKKVGGLILLNPALKLNWSFPSILEAVAKRDYLSLSKVKLPFVVEGKLFCGDSYIAEEFDSDPLINHSLTWGSLLELQHNATLMRTSAYYLDIPVFVGISGKGRLYEKKVVELFAKGIANCTYVDYLNASHDLLHNFECEKLSQDVYNWFEKYFLNT